MAVKTFYFFGSYSSFRPFIMEVESDNNGVFVIPTTGGGYNYNVKTSDGQVFNGVTGNLTVTFPSPNTRYDVEISGLFPRFYFNNGSERLKIKDIKQWGDIVWGAVQDRAFYGCEDMECSALDLPDIEHITSASYMFRTCMVFAPITFDLKFANLTNGSYMFYNATSFNPPNFAPTFGSLTSVGTMFLNSALDIDTSGWDFSTIIAVAGSGVIKGMFYNSRFSVIDMSDPLTGSINLQNMKQLCAANSNLTTLKMQAGSVTSNPTGQGNPAGAFGATPNLKTILMYDLNIDMNFTLGITHIVNTWCRAFFESKVDILNFCDSIRDMTSDVTRAVTLQDRGVFSPSDINDIETAFNLKNWTVIWV